MVPTTVAATSAFADSTGTDTTIGGDSLPLSAARPATNTTASAASTTAAPSSSTDSTATCMPALSSATIAASAGRIGTARLDELYPCGPSEGQLEEIALGRWGTPREFGDVVCFLASERARYVTGQELVVDGGLTVNGTVGHGRT